MKRILEWLFVERSGLRRQNKFTSTKLYCPRLCVSICLCCCRVESTRRSAISVLKLTSNLMTAFIAAWKTNLRVGKLFWRSRSFPRTVYTLSRYEYRPVVKFSNSFRYIIFSLAHSYPLGLTLRRIPRYIKLNQASCRSRFRNFVRLVVSDYYFWV